MPARDQPSKECYNGIAVHRNPEGTDMPIIIDVRDNRRRVEPSRYQVHLDGPQVVRIWGSTVYLDNGARSNLETWSRPTGVVYLEPTHASYRHDLADQSADNQVFFRVVVSPEGRYVWETPA